ncbi:hypothetical protein [Rhodohalobacter sp. 8-1]|uniref:hypothetical protein n=1 Tax=Rhodohalobacter sp. 8-1 TaxID=3131972 RepID=UPI0030EC67C7
MDDELAYGDLYQWGRPADGHQKRSFGITGILSNSDLPGHRKFIVISSQPYDWRSPKNDQLWQRVKYINNPCPDSYRLPTETEWEDERQSWSSNDRTGAFESPLKLPVAGYRQVNNSLIGVGFGGLYWSSSFFRSFSRNLLFDSSGAFITRDPRTCGLSVRCIKD